MLMKPILMEATPLFIAYQKGHIDIVKALLRTNGIDVNKANSDGVTSLDIASFQGHTDIVKSLLRTKGINVNKANSDGVTPLFLGFPKWAFRNSQRIIKNKRY